MRAEGFVLALDLESDGMEIFVLKISYSVHGVVKVPIFSRAAMKKTEVRIQELQELQELQNTENSRLLRSILRKKLALRGLG